MRRIPRTFIAAALILIVVFILAFSQSQNLFSFLPKHIVYGEVTSSFGDEKIRSDIKNIYFVGDVMLGRDVEQKLKMNGFDYPYENFSFKDKSSYVVANFESSVPKIHTRTPNNTFRFSVDSSALPALKEAGFTHLSLANNHTFDHGLPGYNETVTTLWDTGFVPFGHPTLFSTSSVSFLGLGDKKIALIGLHVLFTMPTDKVIEGVTTYARDNSDVQVVFVHWGEEYSLLHNSAQRELAQRLAGNGVDIVVGHHPHVVQDVELIDNTLVFYSLGNFIFDQYFSTSVQQGLVLALDESLQIKLLPVSSEKVHAQPSLMDSESAALFLNNLAKRSDEQLSTVIKNGVIDYSFILASSPEVAIMAE